MLGGEGNAGVAGAIQNTPGAIGYVNHTYIKGKIKAASLQNFSGEYIKTTKQTGAIALSSILLDKNRAGKDLNEATKCSYPISTLTWVLDYERGNGKKTNDIREAFSKLLSDEYQDKASSLGFIPLKGEVLARSRAAVKRIEK